MKKLIFFGEELTAELGQYPNGATGLKLTGDYGTPYGTLSVNIVEASDKLPKNQIYVKDWSENEDIAIDAIHQGLIKLVDDGKPFATGHVVAKVYEINPEFLSEEDKLKITI